MLFNAIKQIRALRQILDFRKYRRIMRQKPANPFELMKLLEKEKITPDEFQNLRYIYAPSLLFPWESR